jgi:hypothetical protein
MIDWSLSVEDVACRVDDIKATNCSRSFVRSKGMDRESKSSAFKGFESMVFLKGEQRFGVSKGQPGERRKAAHPHKAQDIDAGKLMQVTWHVGVGVSVGVPSSDEYPYYVHRDDAAQY